MAERTRTILTILIIAAVYAVIGIYLHLVAVRTGFTFSEVTGQSAVMQQADSVDQKS